MRNSEFFRSILVRDGFYKGSYDMETWFVLWKGKVLEIFGGLRRNEKYYKEK